MQHPAEDDLTLLALGEHLPAASDHVLVCAPCRGEVDALAAVVRTARRTEVGALPPAPPAVWERVQAELGLQDTAPAAGTRRRTPWLLAAAASVVALALATAVALDGRASSSGELAGELQALGELAATGRVVVTGGPDERTLLVDTRGLPPAPDGAYEVWLLDPDNDRLVTLGLLDDSGRAWVRLPAGVALEDYPLVDVSLEPDDGDPGHSGDSVLRGDVPS